MFIHSVIHLFSPHLLRVYYVRSIVLGTGTIELIEPRSGEDCRVAGQGEGFEELELVVARGALPYRCAVHGVALPREDDGLV